jgi:hypothetical protein
VRFIFARFYKIGQIPIKLESVFILVLFKNFLNPIMGFMEISSCTSVYRPQMASRREQELALLPIADRLPALEGSARKLHCEPKELDALDDTVSALFSSILSG